MIHKYHPEQSLFWLIFGINSIVAFGSYFVYGYQVEPVILCILYSFASSTVTGPAGQKRTQRRAL